MAKETAFIQSITEFVKKTKVSKSVVFRKVGFDMYAAVLELSPVDSGRFRASNRISINYADASVEAPRPPKEKSALRIKDPPTAEEQSYGVRVTDAATFGDTIHITNNLPYAKNLEDGGSAQNNNAPDGIYGLAYQTVLLELDRTIRSVIQTQRESGE